MSSKWVAAALTLLLLTNIGSAEDISSPRKGPWPVRDGHNYQPTEWELRALRREDVTPEEGREIDRLYDWLLADDKKAKKEKPASKR